MAKDTIKIKVTSKPVKVNPSLTGKPVRSVIPKPAFEPKKPTFDNKGEYGKIVKKKGVP